MEEFSVTLSVADPIPAAMVADAVAFFETCRRLASVSDVVQEAGRVVRKYVPQACLNLWMLDLPRNRLCRAHSSKSGSGEHREFPLWLPVDADDIVNCFAVGLDEDNGWIPNDHLARGTSCPNSKGLAYLRLRTVDELDLLLTACVPGDLSGDFTSTRQFFRLLGQAVVQAIERIRLRAERELLSSIAQRAVGHDTRRSFFDQVARSVADAFDSHGCSIFIYDQFRDVLTLGGTTGLYQIDGNQPLEEEELADLSYSRGDGLTGLIFDKQKLIRMYDAADPDEWPEIDGLSKPLFRSAEAPAIQPRPFMGAPVLSGESFVGVIRLHGKCTRSCFLPSDERRLQAVSKELGRAVWHWNAVLDERECLRQREALLSNLHDLIDSDRGLRAELDTIANQANQLFQGCSASVLLRVPGDRELVVEADTADRGKITKGMRIPFDIGLCGWAATKGKTVAVPDVATDDRCKSLHAQFPLASSEDVRSEACTPIVFYDNLLGVLKVESQRLGFFHPNERGRLQLLERLASQAAFVICRKRPLPSGNRLQFSAQALLHQFQDDLGAIVGTVTAMRATGSASLAGELDRLQSLVFDRSAYWDAISRIPIFDRPNLQPQFLNDTLEAGNWLFEGFQATKSIEFKFNLAPSLYRNAPTPRRISVDLLQLYLIASNLLSNAVEASSPGQVIEISTEERGDRAVLIVEDHGAGIPEDVQQRLFIQPVSTTGRSGNGLMLVQRMVELHGGETEFEPTTDGGSRFSVYFPLMT